MKQATATKRSCQKRKTNGNGNQNFCANCGGKPKLYGTAFWVRCNCNAILHIKKHGVTTHIGEDAEKILKDLEKRNITPILIRNEV